MNFEKFKGLQIKKKGMNKSKKQIQDQMLTEENGKFNYKYKRRYTIKRHPFYMLKLLQKRHLALDFHYGFKKDIFGNILTSQLQQISNYINKFFLTLLKWIWLLIAKQNTFHHNSKPVIFTVSFIMLITFEFLAIKTDGKLILFLT